MYQAEYVRLDRLCCCMCGTSVFEVYLDGNLDTRFMLRSAQPRFLQDSEEFPLLWDTDTHRVFSRLALPTTTLARYKNVQRS
jgi:hypothetical protein